MQKGLFGRDPPTGPIPFTAPVSIKDVNTPQLPGTKDGSETWLHVHDSGTNPVVERGDGSPKIVILVRSEYGGLVNYDLHRKWTWTWIC